MKIELIRPKGILKKSPGLGKKLEIDDWEGTQLVFHPIFSGKHACW